MKQYLSDLEIDDYDFKRTSGILLDEEIEHIRAAIKDYEWLKGQKVRPSLRSSLFFSFLIVGVVYLIAGFICQFIFGMTSLQNNFPVFNTVFTGILFWAVFFDMGSKIIRKIILLLPIDIIVAGSVLNPLERLLRSVDQHNKILKAIDINDQLLEAGNKNSTLNDRDRVLDALRINKEDIIRAIKTERILRENKDFIAQNMDIGMFDNHFASVEAIYLSERASEYGQFLNDTIQVAMQVQQEMKNMKESLS